MKPIKVRHLLEKHAPIGRIYLAPEGSFGKAKRRQHMFVSYWMFAASLKRNPLGAEAASSLLLSRIVRECRPRRLQAPHQERRQQETHVHRGCVGVCACV